jgi:translation initiation factor 1
MAGLFDGTPLERPVTCEVCGKALAECQCPRDASGKVLLPAQQTAVVRLEKRPGGKVVTLVEGLEPKATDLEGLLKKLKARCAAGGTVQDGTLQIQGDHRPAVGEALRQAGFRVKVR